MTVNHTGRLCCIKRTSCVLFRSVVDPCSFGKQNRGGGGRGKKTGSTVTLGCGSLLVKNLCACEVGILLVEPAPTAVV